MKIKYYASYTWILLGLITIIIKSVTTGHHQWIEKYYSNGLYLGVRKLFDFSLSNMPFPSIYLFFAILALILFFEIKKLVLHIRKKTFSFSHSLRKIVGFIGGLTFFFFFLWGFNYNRLPVEHQLGLEIAPLSLQELKNELEVETKELIELRSLITGLPDSIAIQRSNFPEDLEVHLRENLSRTLEEYHYSGSGFVRGRLLRPKGIFLRFSSAGLYWPFVGEGNIDAGLHPIQWPYVMSHEMSHGFGFADEGTCNFWAFLSCSASPHPAVAYAGHLSYWRSLAIQYMRYEPDAYSTFREKLPRGIIADLNAINQEMQKYPDFAPNLQPSFYDAYLKAQGIPEGMLNYTRVIMLVHAWRQAKKS